MTEEPESLFQHLDTLLADGKEPSELEQEIWATYGRTVAVLVLDSAGFSRVSESHGIIHYLSRLVAMRNIVLPIFERHGHCHMKFEADNAFAAFDRVDDALAAALEIHRAVSDQGLMLTEDEPFRVCIGIGYGNMLYSQTLEGFFGDEMNYASKLGEDTAVGGETLLTSAARQSASQSAVKDAELCQIDISGVHMDYYKLTI